MIKADFQFALIIPSAVLGPGLKIIIFNDYSVDEDRNEMSKFLSHFHEFIQWTDEQVKEAATVVE